MVIPYRAKDLVVLFMLVTQFCLLSVFVFTYYGLFNKAGTLYPKPNFSARFNIIHFIRQTFSYENHPVYQTFKIRPKEGKQHFDLLLIVSSAPKRRDRRKAIRETWWPYCKTNSRLKVKCIFMTDKVNNSALQKSLLEERKQFGDVEFQSLHGGVEFGVRFLFHMVWALENYDFGYFMRMDDDYFLCIERFLMEIPMPVRRRYHWGWVHCIPNLVRPEESIILLSKDLVNLFLGQDPKSLYCHPWADQMIGIWTEALRLNGLFRHDSRLYHDPPAAFNPTIKSEQNICHKYIGVHGSYPQEQRLFWKNKGNSDYNVTSFDSQSKLCMLPHIMKWQHFAFVWRYEPKLCIDNPAWDTSKQMTNKTSYGGRQEGK